MSHENIVLLPTDNRPITYLFPQEICKLANLSIQVPPRQMMGSLFAPTNLQALNDWLEQAVRSEGTKAVLLCLDTLLYGGLIPSRRGNESLPELEKRVQLVADLKSRSANGVKIYVQSSIMRISNNYDNTEEKEYWSQYGQEIFLWSQLLHRKELGILESLTELKNIEAKIEPSVRDDYLKTRVRNFAINEKLIDYVAGGQFDFLIFSQDDSGEYGLNVSEKNRLIALAKSKGLKNVLAYAGADEMLMTLIGRYLHDLHMGTAAAKVSLHFTCEQGKKMASNFEGQSIGESLINQANAQGLNLTNAKITDKSVDFHVLVHTGDDKQGDHIWLPGLPDLRQANTVPAAKQAIKLIEQAAAPVVLCDLAYSNGADPILLDLLFDKPELFDKIWAYAGWNTTGNSVGSAFAMANACLHSLRSGSGINEQMRKQLLFLRLMDDWAYQTQVRKKIQGRPYSVELEKEVAQEMDVLAKKLASLLNYKIESLRYSLPWKRSFEIEVDLNCKLANAFS